MRPSTMSGHRYRSKPIIQRGDRVGIVGRNARAKQRLLVLLGYVGIDRTGEDRHKATGRHSIN